MTEEWREWLEHRAEYAETGGTLATYARLREIVAGLKELEADRDRLQDEAAAYRKQSEEQAVEAGKWRADRDRLNAALTNCGRERAEAQIERDRYREALEQIESVSQFDAIGSEVDVMRSLARAALATPDTPPTRPTQFRNEWPHRPLLPSAPSQPATPDTPDTPPDA